MPPTAVTYGDAAPNFICGCQPESPDAKTTETPRAPSAAISVFIRAMIASPTASSGAPTESECTLGSVASGAPAAHTSQSVNGLSALPSR